MRRERDQLTADLFHIPRAPAPIGGSLDYATELRHVLSDALKKATRSRYEVAARMSELTGQQLTKEMLDSWTAESKKPWRFPFEYAAAFEEATDTNCLQELLGRKRGTQILVGHESLYAELGRIQHDRALLGDREKQIKRHLGDKKK
jgi:hypothetical protein